MLFSSQFRICIFIMGLVVYYSETLRLHSRRKINVVEHCAVPLILVQIVQLSLTETDKIFKLVEISYTNHYILLD